MGINWNPKAAACFFKRMKWRWGGACFHSGEDGFILRLQRCDNVVENPG